VLMRHSRKSMMILAGIVTAVLGCDSGSFSPDAEAELQRAKILLVRGDLGMAESVLQNAITLARQQSQTDTEIAAICDLTSVQIGLGRSKKAFDLAGKAKSLAESTSSNRLPEVLICLGEAELSLGEFKSASLSLSKAIGIASRAKNANAAILAHAQNTLGLLSQKQGNLDDAESRFQKAIDLLKQLDCTEQEIVLYSKALANPGLIAKLKQDFERAGMLYEQALDLRISVVGDTHPVLFVLLANLGTLRATQQNWNDASHYFRRAVILGEQTWGQGAKRLDSVYQNCAFVLDKLGHSEKADAIRKRNSQSK